MTTTTATRTGLALRDVTLTYGSGELKVAALDGVDLVVEPGELVAVVGPSGAGKSSLLAVAGGLTRPTSGSVVVGGVELTEVSDRALATFRRDHVGFVFQSGNLVPALTAIDQLRLVERITGRRSTTPLEDLLDAVGMLEHAHRRPDGCPAASVSASGSRGPSSRRRRCSSSTSRRRPSTGAAATRSSSCSRTRPTSTAWRPSWSRTTTTCSSTSTASSRWSTAASARSDRVARPVRTWARHALTGSGRGGGRRRR